MFLSFFADFDWSVGKIKLFLHFDKTPCAGIFDICLDFTVVDCVDNNELYINYLLELDLLDFIVQSFWENSIGLKMATHSSYPFHYFFIISAMRFLVGNKMDLEKLVSDESVEDFASAHECDSAFFVSAKTGNIWTKHMRFLNVYHISAKASTQRPGRCGTLSYVFILYASSEGSGGSLHLQGSLELSLFNNAISTKSHSLAYL